MPLSASAPPAGFWSAVREALRGSQQDYTAGSVGRAVLLLAVPMVLEMVMESIFGISDIFFVSRLGASAVATVGLTESLLTIVYALAMGLAIAATATVARRIGEQDAEAAARSGAQALLVGVALSVALGIAGAILAPRLLALMGADREVLAVGSAYARLMLGGVASVLLLFLANAVLRGAGDAAAAMRVLWIANLVNIALGPCLVFGVGPLPRLGVAGAAVGTTIGRSIGVVVALASLQRRGGRLRMRRAHFRPDARIMGRLAALASSASLQSLIGTASWIGLVRIVSTFGSTALAGYTLSLRVIMFALLPSWGMSNAAATMVGQSLGAGNPGRAEDAVWRAGRYNVCFLGVVGLAFLLFARPIIGAFAPDPSTLAVGIAGLRIVAAGFGFYAYGMVLAAAFNGAGDTRTPMYLNLLVFWAWEVPLAWLLAQRAGMESAGVFTAIAVAFSTLAVASAAVFRRGRWKTQRV